MEGLIFAAIIMALGAFFNNKQKGEPKTRDHTEREIGSAGQRSQRTFKRVEDYAKEVYGDLQSQMKENPERAKGMVGKAGKVVERLPDREQERIKQAAERGRKAAERLPRKETERIPKPAGRLSAHHEIGSNYLDDPEKQTADLLEMDSKQLQKAIILSEILLPPKSKR